MFSKFGISFFTCCLLVLSMNVSAFKPSLSEEDSQRLAKCMERQSKACDRVDEKTKCRMEAFKNMDRGCQKLVKKSHQSFLPMGMACYGFLKVCPFPAGNEAESMKKFEACVQKNMKKMPPSCQGMMNAMTKRMTGGHSFNETIKNAGKGKGQNVQVQQNK